MQRVKTILNKGRKSYWIRSGTLTVINRLSASFFGFLSFYLLLRILPQAEFGIWMLFISVATVIELIKAGFIRNPLIKFSQKDNSNSIIQVLSASFALNILLTTMIALLLWLSAKGLSLFWNQASLQDLFKIYIITLFLLIPLNHFDYVQQANLSFKGSLFSEIARQFTFFVCILAYYLTDRPLDLINLAFFQVISVGLSAIVSFFFVRKYLSFNFKINRHWISKLFSYGKYTFGTSVSAMLMRNTDTWMLGRMMSPLAVAIYNPALRIANLLEIPALTLASILFPKLIKQIAEEGPKSAKSLYEKSVGAILCCILPVVIVVFIFAEPITILVAGEEYLEAAPILRVTVIYSLLLPFNRQFGVTMDAIGKAKINFLFVLRDAVLNIVLNYVFIIHYGIIGAAYGTMAAYLIALIINQIYLKKYLQISFIQIIYNMIRSYYHIYNIGFSSIVEKKP